jgi:hypothetical protein
VDANFAADDVSGEKSLPWPIEVNVESHDLCYWLSIGELQSKSARHKSLLLTETEERAFQAVNRTIKFVMRNGKVGTHTKINLPILDDPASKIL